MPTEPRHLRDDVIAGERTPLDEWQPVVLDDDMVREIVKVTGVAEATVRRVVQYAFDIVNDDRVPLDDV